MASGVAIRTAVKRTKATMSNPRNGPLERRTDDEVYVECRNCGRAISDPRPACADCGRPRPGDYRCPACGSDEIARYAIR